MRIIETIYLSVVLAIAACAQPALPRPAPDFAIAEPSGRITLLSRYRGEVVLLAFVVTTCSHCQALSVELQKMTSDLGPRGLRVAEVAFDQDADISGYSKRFGIGFPVGKCDRKQMGRFLGISTQGRIGTPQVVLIDRTGMIRAQSEPMGSPLLQSPDVLRGMVSSLLTRGSAK